MSDIVLSVENLSKQYRIGEIGTGTLSNDIKRWWAQARGKEDPFSLVGQVNDRTKKAESDFVWALRDINFEIKQGDVLGVIGKNGAGKSTLLKLISRITAPTVGSIKAKGRIASLLEVGTGMHPEMTARENIYLNGAIMGMTKREISRKFDEIVDFAGCALYVDTPVKRYSSGMRVRLGFAVAAFLEPEILIVDEVLAVGDSEFQKKAIGKMKEVSEEGGRTVLFVSHNMVSVRNLCTSAIVLNQGQVAYTGNAENAISYYLKAEDKSHIDLIDRTDRQGNGQLLFTKIEFLNSNKEIVKQVFAGESVQVNLHYKVCEKFDASKMILVIQFLDNQEQMMAAFPSDEHGTVFNIDFENKKGVISLTIPQLLFRPNDYFIRIISFLGDTRAENQIDSVSNADKIKILNNDFFAPGRLIRNGNCALLPGNYSS
jgi:lipopolysaccharide transport system ATP-binding protein